MDMMRLDDTVIVNTMEKWTIVNETNIAHPFHIHKVQFQITEYVDVLDGDTTVYEFPNLPVYMMGYKDVILINPNSSATFVARFDSFPADTIDPRNGYMYHCHILTHEDHSMMHQFTVVSADVVGIEDHEEMASFSIFPNPANDYLSLKAEAVLPSKVRILDLFGRTLKEQSLDSFIGIQKIDIGNLPPGLLLVEWQYGNSQQTWKIVRQ
jgi:blue copper oxidase